MATIILNVSGKKVETYKSTLKKCEYFRNKIERWDEKTLIDQDYKTFIHFLNILRSNDYVIPKKYVDNVSILANFYGYPLGIPPEERSFQTFNYSFYSSVREYNTVRFTPFNFLQITSFVFKIDHDAELFIKEFGILVDDKIYNFGNMFPSYFTKSRERELFVYTSTKVFTNIFNEIVDSTKNIQCNIQLENMICRRYNEISGDPKLNIFISGWVPITYSL